MLLSKSQTERVYYVREKSIKMDGESRNPFNISIRQLKTYTYYFESSELLYSLFSFVNFPRIMIDLTTRSEPYTSELVFSVVESATICAYSIYVKNSISSSYLKRFCFFQLVKKRKVQRSKNPICRIKYLLYDIYTLILIP